MGIRREGRGFQVSMKTKLSTYEKKIEIAFIYIYIRRRYKSRGVSVIIFLKEALIIIF